MERPNWVRERAECDVRRVFEKLCQEITADVETMQPYLSTCFPPETTLWSKKDVSSFIVRCESPYAGTPFVVRVQLNNTDELLEVTIEKPGYQHHTNTIKPSWNTKQERCEIVLDNDPLAPWEVSKKVLGPLFFPGEIPAQD